MNTGLKTISWYQKDSYTFLLARRNYRQWCTIKEKHWTVLFFPSTVSQLRFRWILRNGDVILGIPSQKHVFFSSKWNMPAVKMICLAVDFPSVPRNTSPNGGLFLVLLLLDVSNTVNGFKIPQCQSRWLASRVLISLSLLLNHPFWEKQVFNPGEQYYINQWWTHCITDRQIVSNTK